MKSIRFAAIAVLLFIATIAPTATVAAKQPPNIVFFFIDDMGFADPSCFGNPIVRTPNIDSLARKGVKLTNFYVNSPICSASRVAITTGQYQQRWRIHSFLASRKRNTERQMAQYLDPSAPTLARILKSNGYATAHFGKWHMGGGRDVEDAPLPDQYGFDESYCSFEGLGNRVLWDTEERPNASRQLGRGNIDRAPKHQTSERYVDKAIDFVSRHKESPFYVRVFPNDVHDAHVPKPEAIEKWKTVTQNPYEQKFFAVLENLDNQVGRLINHLEALGLTENTLILFTSDNGPTDWPKYYKEGFDPPGYTGPFFGRKWSLHEGGIRMPFIAQWKGTLPSNSANNKSVMAGIDILPTICALAGLQLPTEHKFDGVDMSQALKGQPIARGKMLFWEYGVLGSLKPGKPEHISPTLASREGNWKALVNPNGSMLQLYDLDKDPGETKNLAYDNPIESIRLANAARDWWNEIKKVYD